MKHPRPTRAEATDVANAIYDGTTGIMLSGETANGDYPLEAVQTMVRIAERAEKDIDYVGRLQKTGARLPQEQDTTTSICHATCTVATDLNAAAIIPVSMSGFTSGMVARFKPNCPIMRMHNQPSGMASDEPAVGRLISSADRRREHCRGSVP